MKSQNLNSRWGTSLTALMALLFAKPQTEDSRPKSTYELVGEVLAIARGTRGQVRFQLTDTSTITGCVIDADDQRAVVDSFGRTTVLRRREISDARFIYS